MERNAMRGRLARISLTVLPGYPVATTPIRKLQQLGNAESNPMFHRTLGSILPSFNRLVSER
jgi:hypothetical protein